MKKAILSFAAGKKEDACMVELQIACDALAIGENGGMRCAP
jgi:hypothetical protein